MQTIDRDAENAMERLKTLIHQRRVTTDDVRYLGQWVRRLGPHACDDIRTELKTAGYDWMCDAVTSSI